MRLLFDRIYARNDGNVIMKTYQIENQSIINAIEIVKKNKPSLNTGKAALIYLVELGYTEYVKAKIFTENHNESN